MTLVDFREELSLSLGKIGTYLILKRRCPSNDIQEGIITKEKWVLKQDNIDHQKT